MSPAYTSEGKALARRFVVAAAVHMKARSALDLFGHGASALALHKALPRAAVIAVERDPELLPMLRATAQVNGFGFFEGELRDVPGRFDFINLDMCSQYSPAALAEVKAAARKLTKHGELMVTLMAAREPTVIADDRWFLIPKSLERAAGLFCRALIPYAGDSGVPMWLMHFRGRGQTWWNDEPFALSRNPGDRLQADESRFSLVMDDITTEGGWSIGAPWVDDYIVEAIK